jgi:hypothetical protein
MMLLIFYIFFFFPELKLFRFKGFPGIAPGTYFKAGLSLLSNVIFQKEGVHL